MKNHLLALALAACFCAAASEGTAAKNLLKNGDFKEVNIGAPANWTLGKDTAFSAEKNLVTASGKSYNVLVQKIVLPADKNYSLRIRARKNGENGSIGALFLTEPNAKGVKEHTVAWKIPLSDNFSDRVFSFKSRGTRQLNIYRCSGGDSVIEIASVSLTEGMPDDSVIKLDDGRTVTNIMKNPVFGNYINGNPANWIIGRNVQIRTAADGVVLKAGGKAYVTAAQDLDLEAGKEYTIVVKARKFGVDGKLGVLPQKFVGGKWQEAKSVVWNHPLTGEFKDHAFVFRAPAEKVRLNFYRLGNKNMPGGIEIARVVVFAGK